MPTPISAALPFSQAWTVSLNLTPAASPATIAVNEQAFTVPATQLYPGDVVLNVSDIVFVSPPAGFDTTLISPAYARINSSGQIVIGFANLTAVAHTPQAGIYTFVIIRP